MSQPRLLGGRYELDAVIGRGGMAEVYRARDLRLDRTVAVKTLRSDLARDPTFQARFRREAQSAASLNHPSVIAVYDTGEDVIADTPIPYIVMEHVDGSTLRDLLRENTALIPEKALEVTDGILRALDYSHRGGIVHRDIKPANVMLTRNHEVKVMDFGIARAMADTGATMTQTAQVIGTAQYLSPEQARGERVDTRSDIYSTGCVLYELLTGQPPFTGDSPVAIAYQHVREEPVPPSQIDPQIPQWADAIVLKAMAKEADNRYQTATDFRQEIQRATHGQPVTSTAASTMMLGAQQPPQGTQVMGSYGGPPQRTQMQRPADDGYGDGYGDPYLPPAHYDDDMPERGGTGKKVALWTTLAIVFIGGAALIGYLLSGGGGKEPPPQAAVPQSIVGMSLDEAEAAITEAGLKVGDTQEQWSEEVEKGAVMAADPEPGTQVPEGSEVNLVVSKGKEPPEKVTVPEVKGQSYEAAKNQLENLGFDVEKQIETNEQVGRGDVIRTNPVAGTEATKGSNVTVLVSNGPSSLKVPDLYNNSKRAAENKLKELGLKVEVVEQVAPANKPVPIGFVWNQSPGPNAQVAPGDTVTIFVAKKPPNTPTPNTPTPGLPGFPRGD